VNGSAYHRLVIGIAPADALAMQLGHVRIGLAFEVEPARGAAVSPIAAWANFEPEPANIILWRCVDAEEPPFASSLDLAINGVAHRTPLIASPVTLAIFPNVQRDGVPIIPARALRVSLDDACEETHVAFSRATDSFYLHTERKSAS